MHYVWSEEALYERKPSMRGSPCSASSTEWTALRKEALFLLVLFSLLCSANGQAGNSGLEAWRGSKEARPWREA